MIGSDILIFLLSLAFITGGGIGTAIGYGLNELKNLMDNYDKEKEKVND